MNRHLSALLMNVVTAVCSPTEREPGGGSQAELYRAQEARHQGAGQLFWVRPLGGGLKGRQGFKFSIVKHGYCPFQRNCLLLVVDMLAKLEAEFHPKYYQMELGGDTSVLQFVLHHRFSSHQKHSGC